MPTKLAVVGLGRIGVVHLQHALQAGAVTAVVDSNLERAKAVAQGARVFGSVDALLDSGVANAAIIATPTETHAEQSRRLIEGGYRVLLEKPMTKSLASDRAFASWLDAHHPQALMLAFQRRFDAPLQHMKKLVEQGAIGRPFKITSILEDSGPAPLGYKSGGLLQDMSVHNVDEILWLTGQMPVAAASGRSSLFAHRLRENEDGADDGFLCLWFEHELIGHIQVSRNHVSGYRIETWIFGEEGQIHMGRFEQNLREVSVEAYGRNAPIERRVFTMPEYDSGVPEFVPRFGPAYLEEVRTFIECCDRKLPFPVTHRDGIRAMEVIEAALSVNWSQAQAARIR